MGRLRRALSKTFDWAADEIHEYHSAEEKLKRDKALAEWQAGLADRYRQKAEQRERGYKKEDIQEERKFKYGGKLEDVSKVGEYTFTADEEERRKKEAEQRALELEVGKENLGEVEDQGLFYFKERIKSKFELKKLREQKAAEANSKGLELKSYETETPFVNSMGMTELRKSVNFYAWGPNKKGANEFHFEVPGKAGWTPQSEIDLVSVFKAMGEPEPQAAADRVRSKYTGTDGHIWGKIGHLITAPSEAKPPSAEESVSEKPEPEKKRGGKREEEPEAGAAKKDRGLFSLAAESAAGTVRDVGSAVVTGVSETLGKGTRIDNAIEKIKGNYRKYRRMSEAQLMEEFNLSESELEKVLSRVR